MHWRPRKPDRKRISQPDAFYLAQCNLVLCSVVKFGCSRGLVSRHLLGVLQPSVVLQVDGDPGCPPGVTSNGVRKPAALARFRIAAQALYRLRTRPVTAVPAELTRIPSSIHAP